MGWAVVDLATSNRNLEGDKILSWYDISRTMTEQWAGTARAQEPHLQPHLCLAQSKLPNSMSSTSLPAKTAWQQLLRLTHSDP